MLRLSLANTLLTFQLTADLSLSQWSSKFTFNQIWTQLMWNGSHCDLTCQTLFYRLTFLSCKLLNCDILRLDCKEYGLFNKTRNNSVFGGSVIAKFSSITASDCERKCLLNNKCKSINVEKGDKACELVSKTALDVKGSKTALVSKSDWIFKTIDQDVTLVCFDFRSFQAFLSRGGGTLGG